MFEYLIYRWQYYFSHPFAFFSQTWNELRYFYQRGKRGYSDRDVWSFDYYLADVISNGVRQLRKNHCGHPTELTDKEWCGVLATIEKTFKHAKHTDDILDRMFRKYKITDKNLFTAEWKAYEKNRKKNMHVFVTYFHCLWD